MEKILANIGFDVIFLYENMRTCLFTHVLLHFLHSVLTFTSHYIIMVKGLLFRNPVCILIYKTNFLISTSYWST